jgi:hypothetical protein
MPAQRCSVSRPNPTRELAHYRFPCHGHCHLGPTCRCPFFPQIPLLSARVSQAAPILAASTLCPITWSLPSLSASCCLTYARRWVILSPHSLRCHIALLRRPTAVNAAAPPRCRRQAPGNKASHSASDSSSPAGTVCERCLGHRLAA